VSKKLKIFFITSTGLSAYQNSNKHLFIVTMQLFIVNDLELPPKNVPVSRFKN